MNLQFKFWLQYHYPNFKYCTLYVSRTNYGQTDGQIGGRTIQLLDATRGPFRLGHKKEFSHNIHENLKSDLLFCANTV